MYAGYFIPSLVLALIYAGVLGVWCWNWKKHQLNSGIPLHTYFGVTLGLHVIVMLLVAIYYGVGSSLELVVLANVMSILSEGIFYSLLLLIAIGWCIVHKKIGPGYKVNITIYITFWVGLNIFSLFLPSRSIYTLLVLIIILGLYFGLMYYVFAFTQRNIRMLTTQVKEQQEPVPPDHIPLEDAPLPPPSYSSYPPSPSGGNPTPTYPSSSYPPSPSGGPTPTYPSSSSPSFPTSSYPPSSTPDGDYPLPASSTYPSSYPPSYSSPQTVPPFAPTQPQSGPQTIHVHAVDAPPAPAPAPANQSAQTQPHERIPEAQEKLRLYSIFYKLMLFYIVVTVVLTFFPQFSGAMMNVFSFIRLYFTCFFLTGLCYVFRLRPLNKYVYLVLEDQV